MTETCPKCKGKGEIPTAHERRVACMGEEAAEIVEHGWSMIAGNMKSTFQLKDGRNVYVPSMEEIEAPPGVQWNDKYAWYVATEHGDA